MRRTLRRLIRGAGRLLGSLWLRLGAPCAAIVVVTNRTNEDARALQLQWRKQRMHGVAVAGVHRRNLAPISAGEERRVAVTLLPLVAGLHAVPRLACVAPS